MILNLRSQYTDKSLSKKVAVYFRVIAILTQKVQTL